MMSQYSLTRVSIYIFFVLLTHIYLLITLVGCHGLHSHEEHDTAISIFESFDSFYTTTSKPTSTVSPIEDKLKDRITITEGLSAKPGINLLNKYLFLDHKEDSNTFKNVTISLQIGNNKQMIIHISPYHDDEDNHYIKPTFKQAFMAGFLAVTLTNLCSLFGGLIIPFRHKRCYKYILTVMTAIAASVLLCTSIMILLPEILGLTKHGDENEHEAGDLDYLLKGSFILLGVLLFYLLELMLNNTDHIFCCSEKKQLKSDISGKDVIEQNTVLEDSKYSSPDDNISTPETTIKANNRCCGCFRKLFPHNHVRILPTAWMILMSDGIHNFLDGMTIGAGFTQSFSLGATISLSVLLEELPHELGDLAILITSGFSLKSALLCNFLSSCSAYIGLFIGLSVGLVPTGLNLVFAIMVGFFLYISLSEIIPKLHSDVDDAKENGESIWKVFFFQCIGFICGFICIITLYLTEGFIKF